MLTANHESFRHRRDRIFRKPRGPRAGREGADLRLLVRPSSDLRNIEKLNAERVVGDLRDAASLEKGMAGCEAVFHVAADYRLWVRDPEEMYRSNVEGTRAILLAARKNGVRRVVYTSSVATMGFTNNGHTGGRRFSGVIAEHDRAVQAFEIYGGRGCAFRRAGKEWTLS